MKTIVFAVEGTQSYFKCVGTPAVKANVPLPLIVPLDPGGTITLTIEENMHTGTGYGGDIHFSSDQLQADPGRNITGNFQQFHVWIRDLSLDFDPKTGQISSGSGGTYVMGMRDVGGSGNLRFSVLESSALADGNSPGFDMSNGLGCGGGLVLDLSLKDPNSSKPMFDMHVEAGVSMEDLDGDGRFERVCVAGIPVKVGDFATELVSVSFGVTVDGGGIGILPSGHVIRIPPRSPDPVWMPIAEGLSEVVRGLALRDVVKDSRYAEIRETVGRLGLELAEKGLEGTLEVLRKESGP